MNAYLVSQSVFYQVLNAVSDCVLKKMFNGEIIFHLKRIGTENHIRTSVFYRYEHIYIYKR